MRKRLLYAFILSALFNLPTVNRQTAPPLEPLWPQGAPAAKGSQPEDTPAIQYYPAPADKATGAAIVVCPGGSYGHLASHEGHDVALWLNRLGITAFVLKYRLGPRYHHPAMMWDVQRAIRLARTKATEWKIDPHRIGVMGFSAGGHLASTAATHFDDGNAQAADPVDRVSSRPDVAILCYPVITMKSPFTHSGSRKNLLGETPAPELIDWLSNETQVTAKTPPTFLFHTVDDSGVPVENSTRFADALRKNNVKFEMHLFEHGRHGVGLAKDDATLSLWSTLLENWLRGQGFLNSNDASKK
ncbi:MAG: alpha/beta hydrolase [Acidobacteriota bacterium]